jgi:transcriptional regulator with XRE-family HTH domain
MEKLLMSDYFSERLKSLRGDRNKAEFARFLGIPAPMYHRYELGQIPKNENLRVIADKCGVTVDSLLSGELHASNATVGLVDWRARALEAERKLTQVKKALAHVLRGVEELQHAVG